MNEALKRVEAELGSKVVTDRKAATSERRKINMKWCEDERQNRQKEYDKLVRVKESLEGLITVKVRN